MRGSVAWLACSLIFFGTGCGDDEGDVGLYTATASTTATETEGGSTTTGAMTESSTSDSDTQAGDGDGDASTSTGDATDTDPSTTGMTSGPLLDVGAMTTGATAETGGEEYCSFVDIVFVIDNSVSMGGLQEAIGLAFPMFADTLVQALPPGVNVHVGVTSSEMGYSSSGSTQVSNGDCIFTGEGGLPNTAFYITPDVEDTGRNGAQGRLFDPGSGVTYYDFFTDDPQSVIDGLSTWFAQASAIGTGGSNIEMTAAPAGWVVDTSVNQATNAGFLRDEGSVLVLFFMTDEPDQTPMTIEGQPGGDYLLGKIAAAKAGCGGLNCVIGGGFLDYQACSANGNAPLDNLLDGLGSTTIQPLPPDNDPVAAAAEMNQLLGDTLAQVIAETCDEIPPVD